MKKILILLCLSFIFSCQNEQIDIQDSLIDPYEKSGELETKSKEIARNAVLELIDLQKIIHINQSAFMEIYHLTDNEFYIDNYCTLSDLLNPNTSGVYKKSKVPMRYLGEFKKAFEAETSKHPELYPNLIYVSNKLNAKNQDSDFNIEDFYADADLTFYIPYKTDDNEVIIDPYDGTTYIPGVIDAMEGLGYKYNEDTEEFEEIITNDDYANSKMSVIIEPNHAVYLTMYDDTYDNSGSGSGSGNVNPNQYTGDCDDIVGSPKDYIRQVWVGHAKLKEQYDAWISFTGNGGGSEIIIGRTDSREHLEFTNDGDDVVVNSLDESFRKTFSRKDIRKKRKKWLGAIWDFNWECSDPVHEQLYLVYEDDNTSPIDFDFSGIKWGDDTYGEVSLEMQVRTKDEIIRQWERESTEFFATNLLDQGCGTELGKYSFSDREWAWYDCGADFQYTMPHRWVPLD